MAALLLRDDVLVDPSVGKQLPRSNHKLEANEEYTVFFHLISTEKCRSTNHPLIFLLTEASVVVFFC